MIQWNKLDQTRLKYQKDKKTYLTIIYNGITHNKDIRKIHKDLYNATINPNKLLLGNMIKLSNRVKEKPIEQQIEDLMNGILIGTKLINYTLRKQEEKMKDDYITNLITNGRETGKIFFVASKHGDCAKDHLMYNNIKIQGQIYVDAYYNRNDKELCEYIRKNNIRTLQWVIGKPVWFCTRPYCRHYFREYTFDEIKNGKYHIPYKKVGSRALQTPKNASLELYKDRLSILKSMYSKYPTQLLKDKIVKTKILIRKWESYSDTKDLQEYLK